MHVKLYGVTNITKLTSKQFFFYKSCYVKGLTYIMDLFDGNSNFLSMNLSLKENEY